jgi:hypothetical protein
VVGQTFLLFAICRYCKFFHNSKLKTKNQISKLKLENKNQNSKLKTQNSKPKTKSQNLNLKIKIKTQNQKPNLKT